MNAFSINSLQRGPATLPNQLSKNLAGKETESAANDMRVNDARDLKQAFTQFVGETFYGQMLKSMRSSASEPAYFHGGMAERQFQSQLDQHLAQDMSADGAGGLADDLFTSQFPEQAALLQEAAKGTAPQSSAATEASDSPLAMLDTLRRI